MHLSEIHIKSFRNHGDTELQLIPGVNLFTGQNGSGKTNLLDSVFLLGQGRSYLLAADNQLVQKESDFYRIEGAFSMDDGRESHVAISFRKGGRKQIALNKSKKTSRAQLLGKFPMVMITPADISLLLEGSEDRRRFMDECISAGNQVYLAALLRYNRLLDQRNAYLKQAAERNNFDREVLKSYDAQMLEPAQRIHEFRIDFTQEFAVFFRSAYTAIAGIDESASLAYLSGLNDMDWMQLQDQSIRKDCVLERTTAGIHRDDLDLGILGFPIKKYASQGQTKTCLIALKLAQYHYLSKHTGLKPILLLDDICEKIDLQRTSRLIRCMDAPEFGQILITDTDPERLQTFIKELSADKKMFNIETLNQA